MSVHDTAGAGAVVAATLDPHQLAALLKPPTHEQQINYVVEHCNYVLPRLAADSLTTSSFPPTFTCLPTSAALESYLAQLTASHKLAAHRTAQLESQLRQQLLSSLAGVKILKQGLSTLPEDIASTEDKLLELCEDLVIESAAASASSAPGTSKDASQTLMNRLDQLHEAIEQLTKAKHYFSILAQAEDLRLSIVKCDKEQGKGDESLQKLAELDALVSKVEKLSSVGSQSNIGAASEPKLVAFLRAQRSAAFKALRKARCTRLSEAISNAGWNAGAQPNADKDIHHDTAASAEKLITNEPVNHAWADVCQLQDTAEQLGLLKRATAKPTPSSETGPKITAGSDDYQPLLTTQCLVEPMLLRFRYHFDGDRSTNRLDKPEWFLSHIAALIKSQSPLFTPASHARPGSGGVVVRLNRHYANSSLPTRRPWRHVDTYAELLHSLLTPLRRKLASTLPALLDHPSLLAHTVFQALTFDADLADAFPPSLTVLGGNGTRKVSDDILGNAEWFNRWLDGEKQFALSRFEDVMYSPDAWAIGASDSLADDDQQIFHSTLDSTSESRESARTTKSARSVVEILESVSERYQPLPSLSQRMSFLVVVQLPILRSYAQRLTRSLDAFESLSSAFARAMPGEIVPGTAPASLVSMGSDSDMVKGLRGLGRLVKALLSAQYVVKELERWSESTNLIELSEALVGTEGRVLAASLRADEGKEEDRELDAASLGMLLRRGLKRGAAVARPLASSAGAGTEAGEREREKANAMEMASYGVWDEPRRKFSEISTRAQTAIERLVTSETLELLRPYTLRRWDSSASDDEEAIPTPTLIASLSVFSTHLSHLCSILDRETLLPLYRRICSTLSSALVERVVMAGGSRRFTLDGGVRFQRDIEQGWLGVVSELTSSSGGAGLLGRKPHAPWKPALDTARLLTLPSSTCGGSSEGDAGVTLAKAVQIAFDAAEEGKGDEYTQLMDKLGVDDGKVNVRQVLRRRIEVWK